MARGHETYRSKDRPFIEQPNDPRPEPSAGRRRVYKKHFINDDAEFVHDDSAEYPQAYGLPVPPQNPTRSAPWPPVPPQPMPWPATPYAGNWQHGYPTTQLHGQQIPAQHPAVHPRDGFQYPGIPYRGPPQEVFASAQPHFVPQPFQQPPFSRQFYRTDGWHDIRPEQGSSATQHSEYRRGQFEYQANSNYKFPGEPLNYGHGQYAPRPARESNYDPPPSYDDACAAGDRRHPRGSSNTENTRPQSPENRPPQARQATSEDAMKHKIPPGYDLKQWNPDKQPILLVGSVFDANSFGKWIFLWTVQVYGRPSTETEASGMLWFMLILLTRRLRFSAKFISESVGIESIKQGEDKDMVQDFIESGDRRMEEFKKHLKKCEKSMLRPENEGTGHLRNGAGVAFAKAIFSSGDRFEATAKIIRQMELWNERWEANCADVVAAKPDTEQPIDDAGDGDRDSVH